MAQQASPSPVDMQQLQQEVEQLTSSLAAMRSEVQACRDEIHNLRAELEAAKSAQTGRLAKMSIRRTPSPTCAKTSP